MKEAFFLAGSYATEQEEGIREYGINFKTGEFRKIGALTNISNPSYVIKKSGQRLYAVQELTPGGKVSVLSLNKDGEFHVLQTMETDGDDPCHLSMDDRGEFLFVANYTSGSLAFFSLDTSGNVIQRREVIRHCGKSVNPNRQESAHVHFSQFMNDRLYVSDLGMDMIFVYQLDREAGTLVDTEERIRVPEGNGPRHLCFHKTNRNIIYVLCELSGTICVYEKKEKEYQLFQQISTLPEDAEKENLAAAIKMSEDGNYLFTSNRGDDSICAFEIQENNTLKRLDICKTGGNAPRDFALFQDYLVIANQNSSEITVQLFDRKQKKLLLTGMRETMQNPVCILKMEEDNELSI